ncbi:hypothetical protein BGX26_001719 [Mortierella sp. AD094]|nr:hypothetical protein BGX26_001719 [Mortierella sp. AD094]
MSNISEKLANTANSYIGGAKQTVGETLGYPDLAASGAAQKAQADAAQKAADAKTHLEGIGHTVEGQAEVKIGSLTGDKSMEARGHANEALGAAQRSDVLGGTQRSDVLGDTQRSDVLGGTQRNEALGDVQHNV